MNKLIGFLKQINFDKLDIDRILDNRDAEEFDTEWIRVYNAVESLKNADNYSQIEQENNSKIRECTFLIVQEFTNDSDFAGYISDGFGLISDAKLLNYKDSWLDKLILCYENRSIPSGIL